MWVVGKWWVVDGGRVMGGTWQVEGSGGWVVGCGCWVVVVVMSGGWWVVREGWWVVGVG